MSCPSWLSLGLVGDGVVPRVGSRPRHPVVDGSVASEGVPVGVVVPRPTHRGSSPPFVPGHLRPLRLPTARQSEQGPGLSWSCLGPIGQCVLRSVSHYPLSRQCPQVSRIPGRPPTLLPTGTVFHSIAQSEFRGLWSTLTALPRLSERFFEPRKSGKRTE